MEIYTVNGIEKEFNGAISLKDWIAMSSKEQTHALHLTMDGWANFLDYNNTYKDSWMYNYPDAQGNDAYNQGIVRGIEFDAWGTMPEYYKRKYGIEVRNTHEYSFFSALKDTRTNGGIIRVKSYNATGNYYENLSYELELKEVCLKELERQVAIEIDSPNYETILLALYVDALRSINAPAEFMNNELSGWNSYKEFFLKDYSNIRWKDINTEMKWLYLWRSYMMPTARRDEYVLASYLFPHDCRQFKHVQYTPYLPIE